MKRLRIRSQLMLAFGVVLVLAAVIGVSGMAGLGSVNTRAQAFVETDIPSIRLANRTALRAGDHFRDQFFLLVPSSDRVRAEARERMAATEGEIAELFDRSEALADEAVELEAIASARAAWATYLDTSAMLLEIIDAGFEEDAVDYQIGEGTANFTALTSELHALVELANAQSNRSAEAAASANRSANLLIVLALLGAIVVGFGLALFVARKIAGSVQAAARVADEVANGALDREIPTDGHDEVADLLRSMKHMQARLVEFQAAQIEMGEQFDAGETEHRIDASRFPGAYGEMAVAVNGIVDGLNRDIGRGIEVMKAYASGDLRQDMDRLPGKKAVLHESLDAVKANLAAINGEIKRLAGAAAEGDFSQRGDESRYDNDFRAMVADLNELMDVSDRSLAEVSSVLKSLAEGDLTRTIDTGYEGVFGDMARDTNNTVEQLRRIVGGIQRSAESINSAAGEISAGNADLSRRTESQAASLEETASSMEELTSTVKQNAEHSRQARQLATGAADVASRGGEVVQRVVLTMGEISSSSRRIEEIIGVIDGIAFQTNILALNAAVEAARAGEQGRGFAVVASEVRSLAQRSADAAKQIKGLINESVAKVDDGSSLVGEAGATMKDIVEQVRRVTDIIAEIAAASDEQASGIEQVNGTVVQMDEVTQQNAALVEEASASARALEEQAGELSRAVAVFRLQARLDGSDDPAVGALLREAADAAGPVDADEPRSLPAPASEKATAKPEKAAATPPASPKASTPVAAKPASRPAKTVRAVPASDNDEWTEF
ncbi:MAG: methyl-accepting chemotaxis protein [Lysobacteraceae bacterium]